MESWKGYLGIVVVETENAFLSIYFCDLLLWFEWAIAWEQRKLGEYVSIISGEAPSKFEEGTELYVKVDDLNYNDKYVVDTKNKVAEHSKVKRVTKGSVVFLFSNVCITAFRSSA